MIERKDFTLEPVTWRSHLMRSPLVVYTEVAGTPVLVDTESAEVQTLTPVWASIWAALDGRAIGDVLDVHELELTATELRNLLEVLRRLKARQLIVDVAKDAPVDLWTIADGTFHGRQIVTFNGTVVRTNKRTELNVGNAGERSVSVGLQSVGATTNVTVKKRFRTQRIAQVNVVSDFASGDLELPESRLGVLARALRDRSVLTIPGVIDLFAGLAEAAHAPALEPAQSET